MLVGELMTKPVTRGLSPTRIVRLVAEAGATLFHGSNNEAYATIIVKDHFETWRVKDANFKRWIGSLCYCREKYCPPTLSLLPP